MKKYLDRTGTPTNVQNNCLKLSGFSVDITKFFCTEKQRETFRAKKISSTPGNSFAGF